MSPLKTFKLWRLRRRLEAGRPMEARRFAVKQALANSRLKIDGRGEIGTVPAYSFNWRPEPVRDTPTYSFNWRGR